MTVWKMIDGWHYEVSDQGQVRNTRTGRILKPMWTGPIGKQYAAVRLCANGSYTDYKIHVLVCEAFHGNRPLGLWALHRDDDTNNNTAQNLYWGTPEDNAETKAKRMPNASVANAIRQRRAAGEKGRALAKEYGISEQMVCAIFKGRCYDHT